MVHTELLSAHLNLTEFSIAMICYFLQMVLSGILCTKKDSFMNDETILERKDCEFWLHMKLSFRFIGGYVLGNMGVQFNDPF
jgi:hypothetical protein